MSKVAKGLLVLFVIGIASSLYYINEDNKIKEKQALEKIEKIKQYNTDAMYVAAGDNLKLSGAKSPAFSKDDPKYMTFGLYDAAGSQNALYRIKDNGNGIKIKKVIDMEQKFDSNFLFVEIESGEQGWLGEHMIIYK